MKRHPCFVLPLVLILVAAASPLVAGVEKPESPAADAADIVRRADAIRFPVRGFQVDITVTSFSGTSDPGLRKYRILSKGNDRTLVMTTAPAVDKGQIMLMRDKDLWVFMPKISQAVRLPLAQKLTGQVANGDLARANFTGDYSATLVRTEQIGDDHYFVLQLDAARRGVTYHRVLYWVNKQSMRPYQAEFYTVSKRLLKTARYEEYKTLGGAVRPTRLILEDNSRAERSVMDYTDMKDRELPDKVFTKQYLTKLN